MIRPVTAFPLRMHPGADLRQGLEDCLAARGHDPQTGYRELVVRGNGEGTA